MSSGKPVAETSWALRVCRFSAALGCSAGCVGLADRLGAGPQAGMARGCAQDSTGPHPCLAPCRGLLEGPPCPQEEQSTANRGRLVTGVLRPGHPGVDRNLRPHERVEGKEWHSRATAANGGAPEPLPTPSPATGSLLLFIPLLPSPVSLSLPHLHTSLSI